ncbi:hypothetical protein G6L32_05600 [Agrobacterium tumefaciens]|uniref:GDSL-type esterase/lipase family protein n=1 Tax=Agrobacterium tumefaciens TaxID=358 RepID=UPI00157472B2|nr:hypothetical protein [Agrobacterium tumefaciens]
MNQNVREAISAEELSGFNAAPEISDEIRLRITTTPVPPQRADGLAQHYASLARMKPNVRLALVGDSLIANWPKEFWAKDGSVLNLGCRGDKVQNVLWRLTQVEMRSIAPEMVVVLVGTNNFPTDAAKAICSGIDAIVSQIRLVWPHAYLMAIEVPPRGKNFQDFAPKRSYYNQHLRKLAKNGAIDATLNVDEVLLPGSTEDTSHYLPDLLHLSPEGYRKVSQRLRDQSRV